MEAGVGLEGARESLAPSLLIPLQVVSPSLGILHSSPVPLATPVSRSFSASPPCLREVEGRRVHVERQA